MSAPEALFRVRLEEMRVELKALRRELSAFDDCPRCASSAEELDRILHADEIASKLGPT